MRLGESGISPPFPISESLGAAGSPHISEDATRSKTCSFFYFFLRVDLEIFRIKSNGSQ
jgi:hypothetical protein